MSRNREPIEASRFSISIDGVEVGSFGQLWLALGPVGSPRRQVLGHELTHTVQQRQTAPAPGSLTVIFKQVTLRQSAWMLFQTGAVATRRLSIAPTRAAGAVLRLPRLARTPAAPAQAKGTDVAMEELVLAVEGLDL